MRISLISYCDLGASIGIDDAPFMDAETPPFQLPAGLVPLPRESDENRLWLRPGIGIGLRYSATDWSPFRELVARARSLPGRAGFKLYFGMDETKARELSEALEQARESRLEIEFFSCGIALVLMEIASVPESTDPEILMRMASAYEYAAYGGFDSGDGFQREIRKTFAEALLSRVQDRELAAISARPPIVKEDGSYDIFTGYSLVFFPESDEAGRKLKAWRETEGDSSFRDLPLDEYRLAVSWYESIAWKKSAAAPPDSYRRVVRVIATYSLFLGLCDSFQRMLRTRVASFVQTSGAAPISMIKLRALALSYIGSTNLLVLTQNIEIAAVFRVMDEEGHLDMRQTEIRGSVEVLHAIQNAAEEEEASKREGKVNVFITIITSLTFVSVVADFLNLDTLVRNLLPYALPRVGLYAGILLLFAVLLRLLFGKGR